MRPLAGDMHELSICQGIAEVATAAVEALPRPLPRVSSVTVRVGRLTALVSDTLRHYFPIITLGTVLEGAVLIVDEVPIRARCSDCMARFEIDTLCFTCPLCHSGVVELLTGRELEVVSLDTAEEVPCAG
jgi:hydrogenase nickel incorporation protein HypA/HybF